MLIVVRHGRTPANAAGQLLGRRDPELDELGRAQAAAVGIAIPTAARVISSPLMRCRQTAEAINTSVEIDERLIEVDYGDFEGLAIGDVWVYGPNGTGLALGSVQLILKLLYPSHALPKHYSGPEAARLRAGKDSCSDEARSDDDNS